MNVVFSILLLAGAAAAQEPCEGKFQLPVPGGHTIFVEVSGSCAGHPLLYFHGGWGPLSHDLDIVPKEFLIVYFHQRGWGLSEPQGSIVNNTFDDIVEDAQRIRKVMNLQQRWAVFGGSNGATLALMYASKYPESVSGAVLRGYWGMTPEQVSWDYFGDGKRTIYPEEWNRVCLAGNCTGGDLLDKYHALLQGPAGDDGCSSDLQQHGCRAGCNWLRWDALGSAIALIPHDMCSGSSASSKEWYQVHPLAAARLGVYFYRQLHTIPDLKGLIASGVGVHFVNGRFDLLCPPGFAKDVVAMAAGAGAETWTTTIVEHAAHAGTDPGMTPALQAKLLEVVSTDQDTAPVYM